MTLRIFCFLLLVAVLQKDVSAAFLCCDCCDCSNNNHSDDNHKEDEGPQIDYIDDNLIGQYAYFREKDLWGHVHSHNGLKEALRSCERMYISFSSAQSVSDNVSSFFKWFQKHRNDDALKRIDVKFSDLDGPVIDELGVKRQMCINARDFLLSNPDLFRYEIVGAKKYYTFAEGKSGVDQELYYEFLAYILSLGLREGKEEVSWPLFLELNPLIYKIILNQCRITDDLFTSEDFKYYLDGYYGNWNVLADDDKEYALNELKKPFIKTLPQIKMFYNGLCKFLNFGIFNFLYFFKKDEFLELKDCFEGNEEITYEMFTEHLEWKYVGQYPNETEKVLTDTLLDMVKNWSSEDRRKLLIFITGIDSFVIGTKVVIGFQANSSDANGLLPFFSHTCFSRLDINTRFFEDLQDVSGVFRARLASALENLYIFTAR